MQLALVFPGRCDPSGVRDRLRLGRTRQAISRGMLSLTPPGRASPGLWFLTGLLLISVHSFLLLFRRGSPEQGALSMKLSLESWPCLKPNEGQRKQDLFPGRSQNYVCCNIRHQMMMWSPPPWKNTSIEFRLLITAVSL